MFRVRHVFLLLCIVTVGCTAALDIGATGSLQIDCAANTDCPSGLSCLEGVGRCVADGAACVERRGKQLVPAPLGNACTLANGTAGICNLGSCVGSRCGDGFVDHNASQPESCDLGDANSNTQPNACRTTCVLAHCGDNVVDAGETCDDGNTSDEDDCLTDCTPNLCGDGAVNSAREQCDDGNGTNEDGCRNDCQLNVCGDGAVNPAAESCEDGNNDPNDGCDLCQTTQWRAQVISGFGEDTDQATQATLGLLRGVTSDAYGNVFVSDTTAKRVLRLDVATGRLLSYAGNPNAPEADGVPATQAKLTDPTGLATDREGNLYIADTSQNRIRRVGRDGIITTIAGNGASGAASLGVLAVATSLHGPSAVAIDAQGNVYIAEAETYRVLRVDRRTGILTAVAGTGVACSGTGACGEPLASSAQLIKPMGLAFGPDWSLYIADGDGNSTPARVRRLTLNTPTPQLQTVAGPGVAGVLGDGGLATAAHLGGAFGIAINAAGDVFVSAANYRRVRRFTLGGTISTVVGNGDNCDAAAPCGDGGPATLAQVVTPWELAMDSSGRLLISDWVNRRLRYYDPVAQTVHTLVGSGAGSPRGDGTGATSLPLQNPSNIYAEANGMLWVADTYGHRVRVITPLGDAQLVAGRGDGCYPATSLCGDGGAALEANTFPLAVVPVDDGVYVLEGDTASWEFERPAGHRLRFIDATGIITTVSGSGSACTDLPACGDDGLAEDATFGDVTAIAQGPDGALYLADAALHRVRKIEAGIISAVAGSVQGFAGDGQDAGSAEFSHPIAIGFGPSGEMYVADRGNYRVRRIHNDVVSTVAGNGNSCFSTSCTADALATASPLGTVSYMAVDPMGNIYLAYRNEHRLWKVDGTDGVLRVFANSANSNGRAGDGGNALAAQLAAPAGLSAPNANELFIAEPTYISNAGFVRHVAADGTITTVAGNVDAGAGPLAVAKWMEPTAFFELSSESWLVADGAAGRLRHIDLGAQSTSVVAGYPVGSTSDDAPARYAALFGNAAAMTHQANNNRFWVADALAHKIFAIEAAALSDPHTWTVSAPLGQDAGYVEGDAAVAKFDQPSGLAVDALRNVVYVSDRNNHVIRSINLANNSTQRLAGTPRYPAFFGEGEAASIALFDSPTTLAMGPGDGLYIADTGNHRVRRLDLATLEVTTVMGDGTPGAPGSGTPAAALAIDSPRGLTFDAHGNLFVSGRLSVHIILAGDDGVPQGDDTTLSIFGTYPRNLAPASLVQCLGGLGLKQSGDTLLVGEACLGLVLELRREVAP